jgi:hypothetical protein
LTQSQIDGVETILTAWDKFAVGDIRTLSYILATSFHETGGLMQPVREGFAKTDAGARKAVAKRKYSAVDPRTGHVYYGRGHVQLTWGTNYKRLGSRLGLDLYRNPDLALDPQVSADILVIGMIEGLFSGKLVGDYFREYVSDPVGARKVVNGTDKAHLIATHYEAFLAALKAADTSTPLPADVVEKDAKPDAPPLTTDKATIGAVTSFLGAGGAAIFSAVNNPWALLALVVVAIGALLFFTGRLEIRRKAGA